MIENILTDEEKDDLLDIIKKSKKSVARILAFQKGLENSRYEIEFNTYTQEKKIIFNFSKISTTEFLLDKPGNKIKWHELKLNLSNWIRHNYNDLDNSESIPDYIVI